MFDKYQTHKGKFLRLLSELEDIGEGHISLIRTVRHQLELISMDTSSVSSASYHTSTRERTFTAKWIERMPQEKDLETAKTGYASPIVLASTKLAYWEC